MNPSPTPAPTTPAPTAAASHRATAPACAPGAATSNGARHASCAERSQADGLEHAGAWHDIHVVGDDERSEVLEQTNDNLDLGHPTTYADWSTVYTRRGTDSALAIATRAAGRSRIGASGVRVTVTINGEPN